jgi:ABC-type transport system involved in multi-copper enzyme maturation permease subunit
MYIWKCWRNTRSRFILNLILVSVVCALVVVSIAKLGGAAFFQRGGPGSGVPNMWTGVGKSDLGGLISLVILFGALSLGVTGMGEEFKEQTLGFLFTRPRRRSFWVRTCWLVGVSELGVVVSLAVVGIFGGLTYVTGYVYTWRLLAALVPLWVGAIVVYSLTYFLTAVARSSEKGISYSLGILMVDLLLPVAAYYWHFRFASILDFTEAGCAWTTGSAPAFPGGQFIIYAALAFAFLLGTQLVLERAEV